ncbi:MAG: hypothetical protein QNL65_01300 [Opitutales bacterium]|jgi:hypothetical protein|tara:strand:+ start:16 stop:564 length:549 start_codon:yes stop_codon:yes gene_type:complete
MNVLKKLFFKLKDREQILLLISLWVIVTVCFFKFLETGISIYEDWGLTEQMIATHQTVINLKPAIDKALEAQKLEQANKSYDKNNLSNRVSTLADKVFPQRDYRELDTEERERYSQHKVRIKFARSSYENVNEFAGLIRQESPYMFLSEVKIEPNYPPKSRPYDPTTYDATFVVSSVEFVNQ